MEIDVTALISEAKHVRGAITTIRWQSIRTSGSKFHNKVRTFVLWLMSVNSFYLALSAVLYFKELIKCVNY